MTCAGCIVSYTLGQRFPCLWPTQCITKRLRWYACAARLSVRVFAGLQATLQTMTDPNAPGGANVFLGTLILGFSAINGALSAYAPEFPNVVWERCGNRQVI